MKTKICFVCLGNIVRSPLAKALFMQQVVAAGKKDSYEADAAGTSNWHVGEPPDGRMQRVAARHGLIYDHRARQISLQDLEKFDLIIAMDRSNRNDLLAIAKTDEQRSKIRLLREYDPQGGPNASIPDPYYSGIDGFEEVYQMIDRSIAGLFNALESNHDDTNQV